MVYPPAEKILSPDKNGKRIRINKERIFVDVLFFFSSKTTHQSIIFPIFQIAGADSI